MTIISRQELEDAAADAETLEDFINGAADLNGDGVINTRLGRTLFTLAKLVEMTQTTLDPNGVNAALALKADLTELSAQIATRAPVSHTHSLDSLTGGGDMRRLGQFISGNSVSNYDDATQTGFYTNSTTATTNKPPNGSGLWLVLVQAYSNDNVVQIATDFLAAEDPDLDVTVYRRLSTATGWTAWERVYQTEAEINSLFDARSSVKVASLPDFKSMWACYRAGMVIMTDGTARGWGSNFAGQNGLGLDNNDHKDSRPPAFPKSATGKITKIARAGRSTWFVMDNGEVWSCGSNSYGQLGHGDVANRPTPVRIEALNGVNIVDVTPGAFHSSYVDGYVIFLASDGRAWACGYNTHGQLGLGDTIQRTTPTQLAKTDWVRFHCTGVFGHTAGIDSSGRLYMWGYNTVGQIGNGGTLQQNTPAHINAFGGVAVSDVWLFSDHTSNIGGDGASLAITNDGKLWSWGINNTGNLGHGDTVNRTVPTEVTAMGTNNVKVMAYAMQSTQSVSFVEKSDGSIWGAGDNATGILGQGNVVDSDVFVEIMPAPTGGVTLLKSLAFGSRSNYSLFALYSDGSMKAVGSNNNGQLGVGNYVQQNTVQDVLFDVKLGKPIDIGVQGFNAECALTVLTDLGDVWVCGYGISNALGNFPAVSRSTLGQVII